VRLASVHALAGLASARMLHASLVQARSIEACVPFLKNGKEPTARLFGMPLTYLRWHRHFGQC
jgi:hypothetical protein